MDKRNKVLIVIDAQEDFTRGALRNDEAIKTLPKIYDAVDYAYHHFITPHPVIYTMDMHGDNYLETQEGKNLPVPHCIKSSGYMVCPEVRINGLPRLCLFKSTFGTFELINLNSILHTDEIWLCGFCTDICVSANFQILKAAYPEIPIVVIEDCCAGTSIQMHEAALSVMSSCQAKVVKLEDLIGGKDDGK